MVQYGIIWYNMVMEGALAAAARHVGGVPLGRWSVALRQTLDPTESQLFNIGVILLGLYWGCIWG